MIVRTAGRSLLLIRQPDHAALSRRIMEHWTALDGAERRETILHAIGEHDNGWHEPDSEPIVDETTGRILDFVSAPIAVREGVWPRGVARLAGDPWAAALVAQHGITVYSRFRTTDEWREFFLRMERLRDDHIRRTPLSLADLERDYTFVRLGDLASLTFCNGWSDAQEYGGYVMRFEGSRLLISPDPFGGRSVPIEVPARELPDRKFASPADARDAFLSAPLVACSGTGHGNE